MDYCYQLMDKNMSCLAYFYDFEEAQKSAKELAKTAGYIQINRIPFATIGNYTESFDVIEIFGNQVLC
jgi:hypothetical protein